jgi:ADP-dependent NAD(P)H-hydrate dehydratase
MSTPPGWRETVIEPASLHPPRTPDRTSSKLDRGTIVVVAGGPACPGAALLSATAALRAGAGRVQIVTSAENAVHIAVALPESMVHGCESRRHRWSVGDAAREAIRNADAVLVGPGLTGEGPDLARLAMDEAADGACLVLDAAALDGLESEPMRSGCVLLPNPTEVGMIVDDYPDIDSPRLVPAAAVDVARATGAVVAVRGSITAIANPGARVVQVLDDPCPGLAIAGSGDVLAGVVTACCARADDQDDHAAATAWAVAVHREAGGILTERIGPTGFLAGEIAATVPVAMARLTARTTAPREAFTAASEA